MARNLAQRCWVLERSTPGLQQQHKSIQLMFHTLLHPPHNDKIGTLVEQHAVHCSSDGRAGGVRLYVCPLEAASNPALERARVVRGSLLLHGFQQSSQYLLSAQRNCKEGSAGKRHARTCSVIDECCGANLATTFRSALLMSYSASRSACWSLRFT
jgi:hypothetical protein